MIFYYVFSIQKFLITFYFYLLFLFAIRLFYAVVNVQSLHQIFYLLNI